MAEWRIYYGDGSTFSDEDGHPRNAPGENVAVIVRRHEVVGRALCARRDFYAFHDGEWYGHDHIGLVDFAIRKGIAAVEGFEGGTTFRVYTTAVDFIGLVYTLKDLGVVKLGRTLPNAVFTDIMARAATDPGFPRKSGRLRQEPYQP